MGILGNLFGTEKAVDNIIDKDNGLLTQVGNWVGGFNYTDEEKAEARTANNKAVMEFGLQRLKALEPFKVVQRILAFASTGLWAFVGVNVVAAIWIEALYPAIQVRDKMMAFAMSDYVFWPVVVVFALYFSGGVVESIKGKLK